MILQKPTLVFSDGACSGNPGPGGWGSIIATSDHQVLELGGQEAHTTNNRMELTAVIEALQVLETLPPTGSPIDICTDSTYVIRGITQWVWNWRKRGWITTEGKDVMNMDLWKKLSKTVSNKEINWKYVRGHSGIPGNERADEIAVSFSQGRKLNLYRGSAEHYPIAMGEIPNDTTLPNTKSSSSKKTTLKAFSYLSLVQNQWVRHPNWTECEQRVKGQSGARYKKAMSQEEEREILRSWGFKT